MYQFSVCFVFSFFVVASSFPVFEPTFGGGGIDLWLRMSQSNLITPYPRQAGLLYDHQLRLVAERRYMYWHPYNHTPQINKYLISVSTSIRSGSWLFYPEHPICITGDWSAPQTVREGQVEIPARHVAATLYTLMKLSYETPCNFPTSRRKISDLRPQHLRTLSTP